IRGVESGAHGDELDVAGRVRIGGRGAAVHAHLPALGRLRCERRQGENGDGGEMNMTGHRECLLFGCAEFGDHYISGDRAARGGGWRIRMTDHKRRWSVPRRIERDSVNRNKTLIISRLNKNLVTRRASVLIMSFGILAAGIGLAWAPSSRHTTPISSFRR